MTSAIFCACARTSSLVCEVGVMSKARPSNRSERADLAPETSLPAMGWRETNLSASSGNSSTLSKRLDFKPPISINVELGFIVNSAISVGKIDSTGVAIMTKSNSSSFFASGFAS